jgi:hypothetical protein
MAVEGGSRQDLKAHEGTYAGFVNLFKYGTIISFVLAAIVVLLIAS